MKWFLLLFAPLIIGMISYVAFWQLITAVLWTPILIIFVACTVAYYAKHQTYAIDKWEVSDEQWNQTLDRHVKEAKTRNENHDHNRLGS